jgi:hypothetical protein
MSCASVNTQGGTPETAWQEVIGST